MWNFADLVSSDQHKKTAVVEAESSEEVNTIIVENGPDAKTESQR